MTFIDEIPGSPVTGRAFSAPPTACARATVAPMSTLPMTSQLHATAFMTLILVWTRPRREAAQSDTSSAGRRKRGVIQPKIGWRDSRTFHAANMNTALTVSELGRRVRIEAHEAVAIALQTVEVCVCRTSRAAPFGPPTVDSVFHVH